MTYSRHFIIGWLTVLFFGAPLGVHAGSEQGFFTKGASEFTNTEVPTIEALFCDIGTCNKKPSALNPCGPRSGIGVHCAVGSNCPACGAWCGNIPPSGGQTATTGEEIPGYALINHDPDPRSCVDGEPLGTGPVTTAVWNPTSILTKISPFGIRAGEAAFEALMKADAAAAWLVAQRLVNDGKILAAPDMHQGEMKPNARPGAIFLTESMSRGGSGIHAEFEPVGADDEFHIRYRTHFGAHGPPSITIESWTERTGVPDLVDFVRTTVELEPAGEQLPVVASDNFIAPVYRLAGFSVERFDT